MTFWQFADAHPCLYLATLVAVFLIADTFTNVRVTMVRRWDEPGAD